MNPRKVIVIGGGPGGYVAAIRAAQLGAKVTLVEKNEIGGTCLNRGCIPTKSLLHDAKMLRSMRGSGVFQSLLDRNFDLLQSMMERKERVIRELVKGVELLLESHRVTVKSARAELLGRNQVLLQYSGEKKETIETDAVILAPGSKSKDLPGINPDGDRIVTSEDALETKKIPSEMVILGGGYIGVEFATFFSTLGSKVTIVEILENILPGLEGELVRHLRRVLERDNVRVLTQSSVEKVDPAGAALRLTVKTQEAVQEMTADQLLVAVGRSPNLDLDFEKAGVEITSGGIRVNDRMETTARDVYAIGDAIGGTMLAPVAMEEGVMAAENIMGMNRAKENQLIPLCIFTHPEIASVGLTEKEAKARGEVKIGRFPFRSNPKAVISGETDGLIKVVVDRETDKILGVHIIGDEASSLISTASSLMQQGVTSKEFSKWIQAHPTSAEALKEAFLDADGAAIHLPKPLRAKA
ncbi:MAG: dihydrolipoyl dehydrogenase [Thermodesulfobacteriota bacterium]